MRKLILVASALLVFAGCATATPDDPLAACVPGVDAEAINISVTRFRYQPEDKKFTLEGCFPDTGGSGDGTGTGVIRLLDGSGTTLQEQRVFSAMGHAVDWRGDTVVYRSDSTRVEWALPGGKPLKASSSKAKDQGKEKDGGEKKDDGKRKQVEDEQPAAKETDAKKDQAKPAAPKEGDKKK